MKSILLALLAFCLSVGAYAQNAADNAAQLEALTKEKEKSDKDITDPKAAEKAKTWLDRAKTYQSIAQQSIKMDSMAANVAYDSYKKVMELDKDKKGGPGKLAKEAETALKDQAMYYAFMQQGVAKFQGKNYADALKALQMAADINTKDTTAPLYAAIGAQQIQNNNLAKELLEKYMANGGKDPQVYASLVQLYQNDKETDKALATLDKAMAMAPGNKDLSNQKINLMLSTNRMDEAVSELKKQPESAANLVVLGQIYDNSAGKLDDEMSKLQKEATKGSSTTKKLDEAKTLLDTYNSEVTRLTAAIKKAPKNADLKRQLTDVQGKLAEQKKAVSDAEASAKEAASNSGAADAQGKLTDVQTKHSEAIKQAKGYYQKALAMEPNNYDANYNLGAMYFNEAVRMKREVDGMSITEYNAKGKELDGKVCGKFKQALPYFQKAKSIKTEGDLDENLKNLENILQQYEGRKVVCVDSNE